MLSVFGVSRRHLESVGESYWAHQRFATRIGLTMIGAGSATMIHGLAPFLFQTTGSRIIRRLSVIIEKRGAPTVLGGSPAADGLRFENRLTSRSAEARPDPALT